MVKIQYQEIMANIISTQPQPRINRWFVLNLGKFRLGITKPLMPCLPENYKYDFNWSCICKPQTCINLFRRSTSKTVLTILKQTFKLFKFPQHWDIFFNCKVRKKPSHGSKARSEPCLYLWKFQFFIHWIHYVPCNSR